MLFVIVTFQAKSQRLDCKRLEGVGTGSWPRFAFAEVPRCLWISAEAILKAEVSSTMGGRKEASRAA